MRFIQIGSLFTPKFVVKRMSAASVCLSEGHVGEWYYGRSVKGPVKSVLFLFPMGK